mmetsp:Transcript_13139/g.21826  ORF Transcript_13139/g.21826 Transcript_13139/m.21826 type:complete len:354 (-) Transcript_13139:69-1130(-)
MSTLSKGLRKLRSFGGSSEQLKTGGSADRELMTASNSSRQATERERQQDDPHSLSNLIVREHWDAVRLFLSNPDIDETRAKILSCRYGPAAYDDDAENNSAWNNALHYACKYHPPWDVIKAINLLHPQYMTQVDTVGRTVLHIAAKNGVSPQVIRYLCAKNPSAAGAQDVLGRTPLHYVCKHYAKRYSESKCENIPLLDSMRDVARTICRTAPKSVNLEDSDGCCALEYAIECDAPFKVIRDIQKACEKDWKKRRLSGLKHKSLQQDLHDQFHTQHSRLQLEIVKLTDSSMSLSSNANAPPIAAEEGDLVDDGTAKKDDGLPTASGQLAQVAMLSARRDRPSKPAGAPRAMCA